MSVTRRLRRPHTGSKLNASSVSGFNATSWASSHRTASNSKSCFRAPSGLTDSEKSDNGDNGSPRYSFMAPSGYTDSSSDEDEVTSRPPAAVRQLRALTPPQRAAADRSALARQQLLEATQRTIGQFDAAVLEIDTEEAKELARVCAAMQRLRAEDADRAAERAEAAQGQRAEALSRLQDAHRRKARQLKDSVEAVQQVAAEKAAKQAAAEQAAREAAEKQRREAEQKRQQEEGERRQEELRKQEEAAAAAQAAQHAQQEQEQRQQAAATPAQPPRDAQGSASAIRVAPGAAADAEDACDAVRAAEAEAKGLIEDDSQRKERRRVDKFITLQVQQISATQQQVRAKAQALNQFLRSMQGPGRAYTLLQLSRRLLSYCEAQVALSHSSAFAVAEVTASVLGMHADFAPILLGKLHEACMLAVPKVHILFKGRDQDEHLRLMGYKRVEQPGDAKTGNAGPRWEATDDYASRMQGFMMFYGALCQSEQPGNPVDLAHAWRFVARLLNHLPAARMTATALEAFLKAAGFRMHRMYGRQFHKLLGHIDSVFLPDLEKQGDPEARPVMSRLRTYMHGGQFQREPELRRMPVSDESTADLVHNDGGRW